MACPLWSGPLVTLSPPAWLSNAAGSCGPAFLWHSSLPLAQVLSLPVPVSLSGDFCGWDLSSWQASSAWCGSPMVLSLQHWS